MASERETPGDGIANIILEVIVYAACLWATWQLGWLLRGRVLRIVGILIAMLMLARAEQCRRETRRAGDYNTDFYIMIPFMCGVILLLRLWLNH